MEHINKLIENLKANSSEFASKNNLHVNRVEGLIGYKYDQLNTKKSPLTNLCRGIVFDENHNLVSLPFERFGNYNPSIAKQKGFTIENCVFEEKTDGTMINLYHHNGSWNVGTTGSPISVANLPQKSGFYGTFQDLFEKVMYYYNTYTIAKVPTHYTLMFELTTDFNRVVNKYEHPNITLIGGRNMQTLVELDEEELNELAKAIGCKRPKQYTFKSFEEAISSLNHVAMGDLNYEGYIVKKKALNGLSYDRMKMKSNKFVISHLFGEKFQSHWKLVNIVLNNEVEEVVATIPDLKADLEALEVKWNSIKDGLLEAFKTAKETVLKGDGDVGRTIASLANEACQYNKDLKVFNKIFFSLLRDSSITFQQAVNDLDIKKVYKALNKL